MKNLLTITVRAIVLMILSITMINANDTHVGIVVKVVDGDTIKIKSDDGSVKNYRLAGLDTPESANNSKMYKDAKNCKVKTYLMLHMGIQAKEFLEDWYYRNKEVHYTIVDTGYRGRPVIVIKHLNEIIVELGLGVVEDYKNLPKEKIEMMLYLERKAKASKFGVWRYLDNKCM